MKLEFEDWIYDQNINEDAIDLFREAFICFRSKAYRPSLLFSYLGLLTILKSRLLSSDKLQNIRANRWDQIQRNVSDEDLWDRKVFEETQRSAPNNVFDISDDLRNQVKYWKNRRNDCVHSKSNTINHAHLESFWQFIKSNLDKFAVSGSKAGLLNKFEIRFDQSLTPKGADYSHLIEKIPAAVEPNEYSDFYEELLDIFSNRAHHFFDLYSYEEIEFFRDLLDINSNIALTSLLDFFKVNIALLIEVLKLDPSRIHHFSNDPMFIRNLWYEHLFNRRGEKHFPIYVSLLRNELIPEDQINEAHLRVISRLSGSHPNDAELETLINSGFVENFKVYVYDEGNINIFDWANPNSRLVVRLINQVELDESVITSLFSAFSAENHPWDLRRDLNIYLIENRDFNVRLRDSFQEFGVPIPRHLESLNQ